jgi:hypothetical protein
MRLTDLPREFGSAWFIREPGSLCTVEKRGTADQVSDAGSSLYPVGERELLAALALEGVASLRVPVALAAEQDQPLAATAAQDDPFRSLDLKGPPHVIFPLSLARCSITLACQDPAHNVNLAEVDGGYASGIKNLCSLNVSLKFTVGGTKKR